MIRVEVVLDEIGPRRGVPTPFALSKMTGINYAVCYKLWHGQVKMVSLATLGRLCEALKCTPGDLLVISK